MQARALLSAGERGINCSLLLEDTQLLKKAPLKVSEIISFVYIRKSMSYPQLMRVGGIERALSRR